MIMLRRTPIALLAAVALTATAGCRAQRYMVFVSAPSAADVYLDGEHVGRTPLELPFEAYGSRHVTLSRPGYRDHTEVLELEVPWYSVFPLDYVSEILLPFGWEDRYRLEVVLQRHTGEVSRPDLEAVLNRAESLRRGGPAGPNQLPPAPPKTDPGEDGGGEDEGP